MLVSLVKCQMLACTKIKRHYFYSKILLAFHKLFTWTTVLTEVSWKWKEQVTWWPIPDSEPFISMSAIVQLIFCLCTQAVTVGTACMEKILLYNFHHNTECMPFLWLFTTFFSRRNSHGVPREKIQRMKEQYDHDVTFHVVLHSEEPVRYFSRSYGVCNMGDCSRPSSAFPNRRANSNFTNGRSFTRRGGFHRVFQNYQLA